MLADMWKRWQSSVLLGGILVIAFTVRLYELTTPLADWHSFRQADTASVTREFVKNGVNLLYPRYHDISNIQSGKFNPQGWRMVEFPLVNGVLAWILRFQPEWNLVVVSRLASVFATVISIAALAQLIEKMHDSQTALVAALVWAIIPYGIYYGRVILPEPFVLMFVLISLVAWYKWLSQTKGYVWLLLAGISGSLALLVKPMAVFYAPVFLGVAVQVRQRWLSKNKIVWQSVIIAVLTVIIAVVPLLLWRRWIQQFPEGIPASDWLLNGNGIRLKPAWWRWLFADRIGRLMFGNWGAGLLALGGVLSFAHTRSLSSKATSPVMKIVRWVESSAQKSGALWGGLIGTALYLIVFASGNVQHDYYQIIILPVIVWLWAVGAVGLIRLMPTYWHKTVMAMSIMVIASFSWFFAWYFVKDWYHINNWAIVRAGEAVRRHTPADSLIIAPYMGDTAFLFQTDRRGWPLGFDIDEKIEQGAAYYVSTSKDDEANELRRKYPVIDETDDYILIHLQAEGE
jgi:hypothetical protein